MTVRPLNGKFNFIFDGGRAREEQIALSLKRHLFPHGGRKTQGFWIYYSTPPPHLEYYFRFFELSTKAAFAKAALDTLSEIGRTPKGAYSTRGRSRHLLETPFSEPLLRTLLRTLFYCKTHIRPPSQNPSENPFPRTLPRTFSEPFLERCVAVRPLRRAP